MVGLHDAGVEDRHGSMSLCWFLLEVEDGSVCPSLLIRCFLSLSCEPASVIGDYNARHHRRERGMSEALRLGIGSAQVSCACQALVGLE